jgi:hypothetical protein
MNYSVEYLDYLKSTGQFILVDKSVLTLVHGRNIVCYLQQHTDWIFVLNYMIVGTPSDVSQCLNNSSCDTSSIFGIDVVNVNAPEALEWINYFKQMFPSLSYPVSFDYRPTDISVMKNSLMQELNINHNFITMPDILGKVFNLYDKIYFNNELNNIIRKNGVELKFAYSDKLTKTGGHCSKHKNSYKITISRVVILSTFTNGEKCHVSNGLQCSSRLECLLNIFEHELIHFVIQITKGHIKSDPIYKSHGKFFRALVNAYFGHTETKHSLLHNLDKVGKREEFNVGDTVTFKSKSGDYVVGKISKLNPKRAVVDKYSVPYTILKHSDSQVTVNTSPIVSQPIKNKFKVGDIISYTMNGVTETNKILRVNEKTYSVGKYRIHHSNARIPKDNETCSTVKTAKDFYVGQVVTFQNKKGQIITDKIIKINPSKAKLSNYLVPYHMLIAN